MAVALKHERRAFLLTVRSAAYPYVAPPIGLERTFEIIYEMFSKNQAIVLLTDSGVLPDDDENGTAEGDDENKDDSLVEGTDTRNAIYIADMDIDPAKKLVRILIGRGDPQTTNPGFTNPATKKVRIEAPHPGEAVGYSAHLLISYHGAHVQAGIARAVLEKMPTISRSIVFPFLNRLLKKYAAANPGFEYEALVRGKPKPELRPFRPRIHVAGKRSSTLKKDLQEGYVSSVDLIDRRASFAGLDSDDRIKEVTRRLEFKLDSPATKRDEAGIFGLVNKLKRRAKEHHFQEVQVHVRGLPGNATASPRFSVDVADAADVIYIRTERIFGFSKDLEQMYAKIESEIADKLHGLLTKSGLWAG